jgi:dipeptidyl aminopeptidase/acylaminoacyl peptidase
MPSLAPYGSWKSPLTTDLILANVVGLGQLQLDGDDVYWVESRPQEAGRYVVVRRTPDGANHDLLPAPWNVRTRVHEYGGGAYLVVAGTLYFSNYADQRLYRMAPGAQPEPLTPPTALRYADYVLDAPRRLIAVREDHTSPEVTNTLVSVALDGSDLARGGQVLASGCDFYSTPRLSPDGAWLSWLEWNHPNMPWDSIQLYVAPIAPDGSLGERVLVAGNEESIFQPTWSPDGVLYFISDRSGWWNLYRWQQDQVQPLHPMPADFGLPQWVFDMRTFAFESPHRLVCTYQHQGNDLLASLDTTTLTFQPIDLPYTAFDSITARPGQVLFIAGSTSAPYTIVQLDPATRQCTVLRRSADLSIDPGYISVPESIEFPTEHGLTAHAFYYPPTNRDYQAPHGELPPLIVESHGGPTAASSANLNLSKQFWTSRGFALVDVNYGGSTGYGRAYRERLRGQFGVVDVDDCTNAALYLARSGKVDPQRLAIHGGSAGGYTTLAALTFRKVFQAGASHYGISDIETLAQGTHKFESRYIDSMIGPYPAARDLYVARSPIHFIDQLSCALILFQGSEDPIVLPEQARQMYAAVLAKGLPVAYLEFPGEQHGFRQAAHIKRSLEAELYFYSKVFAFTLADPIEPVDIANL